MKRNIPSPLDRRRNERLRLCSDRHGFALMLLSAYSSFLPGYFMEQGQKNLHTIAGDLKDEHPIPVSKALLIAALCIVTGFVLMKLSH